MSIAFLPSGDTGLTVQFGETISREINARVIALHAAVNTAGLPGVVETVPTYRSLLVHYDPLATTQAELTEALRPIVERCGDAAPAVGRCWRLPVCFDDSYAPDLPQVAAQAGLSPEAVIDIMTGTRQFIYMLGFAPGQPYLGDLPEGLDIPRRENPIPEVPAGSVLIAAGKTTIYPFANPTGWYSLGRTPVTLFDPQAPSPALLSPGDEVVFERVSGPGFDRIAEAVRQGSYDVPVEESP